MPRGIRPYTKIKFKGFSYIDINQMLDSLHAEGLAYSLSHIRFLAQQGKLPARRHKNRWFFREKKTLQVMLGGESWKVQKRKAAKESWI